MYTTDQVQLALFVGGLISLLIWGTLFILMQQIIFSLCKTAIQRGEPAAALDLLDMALSFQWLNKKQHDSLLIKLGLKKQTQ